MSTADRASRASAVKMHRAAFKSTRASSENTRAELMTLLSSTLLQVFLDAFGFAEQERNVLVRHFHKGAEHVHGLGEFLGKLLVLLIAPGVAQGHHLAVQHIHLVAQIRVEMLEALGKAAQFPRIDDCFRHDFSLILAGGCCVSIVLPGAIVFKDKSLWQLDGSGRARRTPPVSDAKVPQFPQYALAKTTRPSEGLPVRMHLPFSAGRSKGMQRMVALVSAAMRSSLSRVPSQWAKRKPPGSSILFLKS